MRILFCNITYLKYYDGRVAGEYKPKSGGRWVQENEDAQEFPQCGRILLWLCSGK